MSAPALLVLHALRLTGMAEDEAVARRTGVDPPFVSELLLDFEASGWVTRVEFAGVGGWTLTERGRAEDSRRLGAELDAAGARSAVRDAHREFEPLNARLVRACTDWQLRPDAADPSLVLQDLGALADGLDELVTRLVAALARFGGYDERFRAALLRARAGEYEWVTGIGIPSCHVVWMELHEDLLSTLGIERGADSRDRR